MIADILNSGFEGIPIFMLYKRLILALKEPLSPTLPVRMM